MIHIPISASTPYAVHLGSGLLDSIGTWIPGEPCRAMIISDDTVFGLYGAKLRASLERDGYSTDTFVFPAGEASKRMDTLCNTLEALAAGRFSRKDLVVALGGGVTGDMAGFAAATFLRGIDFIQIPTTLLAQVDSSVGGKTGVDTSFGKNLVGAFHQPRLVLIDPDTLSTLPDHFFRDGMGEVIKYGCIRDPELFELISDGSAREHLEEVLYRCVDCKRQVVEHDALDKGERMILNFGHTLGHALEKLHGFEAGALSHGMGVGIGMVWITRASEANGLTQPGTARRIADVLAAYQMPVDDSMPLDRVIGATAMDKKGTGDSLRLIVLDKIGSCRIYPVKKSELPAFFGLSE